MTHNETNFSPDFWVVIATLCAALLPGALRRARRSESAWLLLAFVCLAGLGISLWTLAIGHDAIVADELVAAVGSAALLAIAVVLVSSAPHIKKIAA